MTTCLTASQGCSRTSYVMVTAGGLNLVMTTRRVSVPWARSDGNLPFHSRADPPTAEWGHPGSNASGRVFSVPSARRNRVPGPPANGSVRLLSNTPPAGTFGRPGESDQSTVAQPESGWSSRQLWPGRLDSRSATTNVRPAAGAGATGTLARIVTGSWKPGSPKADAAGRRNVPAASTSPEADALSTGDAAGALAGVLHANTAAVRAISFATLTECSLLNERAQLQSRWRAASTLDEGQCQPSSA